MYNYLSGSGTLQLNVSGAGGIIDNANNSLSGPFPVEGESYTVALDEPAAPVAALLGNSATTSTTVNWTD
ncbi:MAG TPA: hypothetical protein PKC24_13825, partial [Cyclobacteriaceae bacterium]|nr:hypothetical protein [Cyclobacteriaceae bacterium]